MVFPESQSAAVPRRVYDAKICHSVYWRSFNVFPCRQQQSRYVEVFMQTINYSVHSLVDVRTVGVFQKPWDEEKVRDSPFLRIR